MRRLIHSLARLGAAFAVIAIVVVPIFAILRIAGNPFDPDRVRAARRSTSRRHDDCEAPHHRLPRRLGVGGGAGDSPGAHQSELTPAISPHSACSRTSDRGTGGRPRTEGLACSTGAIRTDEHAHHDSDHDVDVRIRLSIGASAADDRTCTSGRRRPVDGWPAAFCRSAFGGGAHRRASGHPLCDCCSAVLRPGR